MNKLVTASVCVLLLSCSRTDLSEADYLRQLELANEAKGVVLFCTGDLEAASDLFETVLSDLHEIRSTYGVELQIPSSIAFMPPWILGAVVITHQGAAATAIAEGTYTVWDSLNEIFAIEHIEPSKFDLPGLSTNHLYTQEALHPERMSESYAELPDVVDAIPERQVHFNGACEQPNLYPFFGNGYRSYLFHDCVGGCRSGCSEDEFWYFRFVNNELQVQEYWNTESTPVEPEWWSEAEENYNLYYNG